MAANINTNAKSDAKETLKRLFVQHKGEVSHPEVREALDNLVQLAEKERDDYNGAEWSPAHSMDVNQGRWRAITTPPFPGKLPEEADCKRKFTLGRMTFGMFKPTKMVCVVEDIVNVVKPIDANEGGSEDERQKGHRGGNVPAWTQTYNLEVLMDIEASSAKLPAKLTNYAVCFPKSPTRLGVRFSSGTLAPRFDLSSSDNATLAAAWKETFGNAVAKEAESQSYLGKLGTWLTQKLMKMMMGLEMPIDMDDFTQTYKIGRPRMGHLDILYLDEDFRVTRGNRGTIVVVERLETEAPLQT